MRDGLARPRSIRIKNEVTGATAILSAILLEDHAGSLGIITDVIHLSNESKLSTFVKQTGLHIYTNNFRLRIRGRLRM